jgi:hypothetical protein
MVVSGSTDVVDIAGTKTLLASCRAGEIKLDFAKKVIFELVHAGRSEENGRIPGRDQHVTRLTMMSFGLKEG